LSGVIVISGLVIRGLSWKRRHHLCISVSPYIQRNYRLIWRSMLGRRKSIIHPLDMFPWDDPQKRPGIRCCCSRCVQLPAIVLMGIRIVRNTSNDYSGKIVHKPCCFRFKTEDSTKASTNCVSGVTIFYHFVARSYRAVVDLRIAVLTRWTMTNISSVTSLTCAVVSGMVIVWLKQIIGELRWIYILN
jgi:hypothetical protein